MNKQTTFTVELENVAEREIGAAMDKAMEKINDEDGVVTSVSQILAPPDSRNIPRVHITVTYTV